MEIISDIKKAQQMLNDGAILAYPTEAIYGFGCDPYNESAVIRLLSIKQRSVDKGLILLISRWEQLSNLVAKDIDTYRSVIANTWPGPVTWLFPKSDKVPKFISGAYKSIAVRMTAHKIAQQLCENIPIVSTSANITDKNPACSIDEVMTQFAGYIDGVVVGDLGGAAQPSCIYDVITGERLR